MNFKLTWGALAQARDVGTLEGGAINAGYASPIVGQRWCRSDPPTNSGTVVVQLIDALHNLSSKVCLTDMTALHPQ